MTKYSSFSSACSEVKASMGLGFTLFAGFQLPHLFHQNQCRLVQHAMDFGPALEYPVNRVTLYY